MAVDFEIDEFEDGSIAVNSVTINGDRFDCTGDDGVAVPKAALAKVLLKKLDKRATCKIAATHGFFRPGGDEVRRPRPEAGMVFLRQNISRIRMRTCLCARR